jgi:hypothetical protein
MRCLASALVALALVLAPGLARAAHRKVALVNANDALERQARIALSPWDLDVERLEWTALSAGMPSAAREARRVAEAHKVDAVVWISDAPRAADSPASEHALWIYDVAEDQIVSRPLAQGVPQDAASAASVALTVKTLMRSSTVAPEGERVGAAADRAIGPLGLLRAEAEGGARALAIKQGAANLELRFGVDLVWFPRFLDQYAALGIGVNAGPGAAVTSPAMSGRLIDIAFAPFLRFRFPLASRVALEPSVGGSAHLTTLDGAIHEPTTPVRQLRWDPSLDASLLLTVSLGRGVDVGLRAAGSYLVRYQRYTINQVPVLELSQVQIAGTLVLAARLN